MPKILFRNARLLFLLPHVSLSFGDVLIVGNRIAKIGVSLPVEKDMEVIDCDGNLLMPGFKNAHAHSAMPFARSCSDGFKLWDWLNQVIFPMEETLRPGDIYHLSKVSFLEYLTSGITACFDMYLNPEEQAQSAKDFGMRSVVLLQPAGFPERYETYKDKYFNGHMKDGLVTYQLGFHAEYTTKPEDLKKTAELAKFYHLPVYTHCNETLKDVSSCIERNRSMRPIEYLDGFGLFDYGGGIFHGTYLSESELTILHDRHVGVVTNPGSNSKLASGIAHLLYYIQKGLLIGIGTDGAGSNNSLDMFYEMRLAAVLQKIQNGDPIALDALEVLTMATVHSAQIMGLAECLDLKEGQLADLILIDLERPSMQPINDIPRNLVYAGSKDCIKLTMIDGKILYRDGKFFVGEDIRDIYRKGQEITERLKLAKRL